MSLAMTDHIHHPQAFHAMSQSHYAQAPVFSSNAMQHVAVDNHARQMSHHLSPTAATPTNSLVYAQANHASFSADGSRQQQQHFAPHQSQFHPPHASQHLPSTHTTDGSAQTMAVNPGHLRRSVGPSRVQTRRQTRALASQLGIDVHGTNGNDHQSQGDYYQEGYMLYPNAALSTDHPRPSTPTENSFQQSHRSVSDSAHPSVNPAHVYANMSPPNPSTPSSTSSSFSGYGFHPYASHSRSTSSSTHPRSNSPAMSVMSVATSLSSGSSTRRPPLSTSASLTSLASTPIKPKKRLVNRERKEICEYAARHPDDKQEHIASLYGVERSTVSKILKQRDKWLSIAEGDNNLVAKHRPSKFPEIELLLQAWLEECRAKRTPISDSMIRSKAREVARNMGIGDDKFKASSGWVENYKHRQGIRKGVWEGRKFEEEGQCDPNLAEPDLRDDMGILAEETQKFADMREADAAKAREEQARLCRVESAEQIGVGASPTDYSGQDSSAVTPEEASQMQTHQEELTVSSAVSADQWPPPPPESMGIAPHETYHEPPSQMNEQRTITLGVPHMSQALQEVHIPQAGSTEHHDTNHPVYQLENADSEMVSSSQSSLEEQTGQIGDHNTNSMTLDEQQGPDPPPFEQDWNAVLSAAIPRHLPPHVLPQLIQYLAGAQALIRDNNIEGLWTAHELNVLGSMQKVAQSAATAP